MDRVLLAVDRTHYNLTPAQKQVDGYQQVFTSAAIMHFGAGVRPDIGKVILAQATPPATIENMLAAAEAVEAEQAKKGTPGASALAIAEPVTAEATSQESASASSFDFGQFQTQLTELTEVVSAIASKQPFDFSKIKCYRCGKYGHFQNRCNSQQRNNPGPNRRFQRQTRRGGRNAFRGSSRAQYPIEQDQEETPDDQQDEDQDPWITGNF